MKTKRSYIIVALVLVFAFILGMGSTYAWFTHVSTGNGSVQFGKIDIDVSANGSTLSENVFNRVNLFPGDSILTDNVVAKKNANSSPFYFRVEISFTMDDVLAPYLSDLKAALMPDTIGNSEHKFVKDNSVSDKAVYYYGTSDTSLTSVTGTGDIVVLDKAEYKIPLSLEQLSAYAQYGKAVSLYVDVVAIQSANVTGTVTGFKNAYDPSSTTSSDIEIVDGYVYFGSYPQTLKASGVTVSSTIDCNGYYTGSDGEKYVKQTVTNSMLEWGWSDTNWAEYAMNKSTDGRVMTLGTDYYFKVEPIKWRVLTGSNGKYTIVCDSILSGLAYQPNYVESDGCYYATDASGDILTDDNGNQVFANNYEYSNLRTWLNATFLDSAFTSGEQSKILTTEVDNGVSSLGPLQDDYAEYEEEYSALYGDTSDKIYALSLTDIINTSYGFNAEYEESDIARYWATTDYARATGAMTTTEESITGNSSYEEEAPYIGSGVMCLRSPYPSDGLGVYVVDFGHAISLSYLLSMAGFGAVPALNISLA